MSHSDKGRTDRGDEQQRRKARLAEQLRENLQRRKAQARSRRAGEADSRDEGLMKRDEDEGGKSA